MEVIAISEVGIRITSSQLHGDPSDATWPLSASTGPLPDAPDTLLAVIDFFWDHRSWRQGTSWNWYLDGSLIHCCQLTGTRFQLTGPWRYRWWWVIIWVQSATNKESQQMSGERAPVKPGPERWEAMKELIVNSCKRVPGDGCERRRCHGNGVVYAQTVKHTAASSSALVRKTPFSA